MERSHAKAGLLNTPTAGDVVYGLDSVTIGSLNPMRVEDINTIGITNARAEVAQVVTIGGTTDPTIDVGVQYIVGVKQILRKGRSSNYTDTWVYYKASISSTVSAAADRQAIYDSLTSKINADKSNRVTASAGTGGTAMTITDDGNYYSGHHNSLFGGDGPVAVQLFPDSNGDGFVDATHKEITTAAVTASGQGADLQAIGAGLDVYGHLVSGAVAYKDALSAAVSGQTYTFFSFESVVNVNLHTGLAGGAWKIIIQECWAYDGYATYGEFLEEVEYLLYNKTVSAPNATTFTFKDALGVSNQAGLVIDGTDDEVLSWTSPEGSFMTGSGASAVGILTPRWADSVLTTSGDALGEGWEVYTNRGFVVGTDAFSIRSTIAIADLTDALSFAVGFRDSGAYDNDPLPTGGTFAYDNMAAIGWDVDNVPSTTSGNLFLLGNVAGTVDDQADDSGVTINDTDTVVYEVRVNHAGTVSYFVDGVDVTDTQTTALVLTDGATVVPFCMNKAAGANDAGVAIDSIYAVPAIINR